MKSAILSKKQLKELRYKVNKALNTKGEARWTEAGVKMRKFATDTNLLAWEERYDSHTGDTEVTITDAIGHEACSVVSAFQDIPEPEPHQDIEDAVAVAVEHLNQEAEPPQEAQPAEPKPQPEVHLDRALGSDKSAYAEVPKVTIQGKIPASVEEIKLEVVVEAINPREKLRKCATMRLAKEYGMAPETELSTIVEKFGNDAVVRYQDLLKMTPSFGLTEADVRHVFPQEYASLPL